MVKFGPAISDDPTVICCPEVVVAAAAVATTTIFMQEAPLTEMVFRDVRNLTVSYNGY